MGKLEQKVAVVTGSSRGLGLAIARAYAREGAAVVISSRSLAAAEPAAAELRAQGKRAQAVACDVAERAQVEALADFAMTSFGRLDIWVNNAALSSAYGPTVEIDPDEFERVTRANIFGTYYGSQAAMRRFLAQGSGKLINMAGRGSDRPAPLQNAYGSSKIWIKWFTQALAEESKGRGVEVHLFNPGLMFTDMVGEVAVIEGYEEKMKPFATILRMWAKPAEVAAEKAVWLASAATDGRSGQSVNILTTGLVIGGALREGLRRVFRQPGRTVDLHITSVPAHRGK
jgi:NAD(P)-dependent dehydrogenase (short-subunit alcohol dehydrogenase family)